MSKLHDWKKWTLGLLPAWVAAGIGLAAGLAVGLLWISENIASELINLLGAFLGAAVTVAGAWWITEGGRWRARRQLHVLLLRLSRETLKYADAIDRFFLQKLAADKIEFAPPGDWGEQLAQATIALRAEVTQLADQFPALGVGGRRLHDQLVSQINALHEAGEYMQVRSNIDLGLRELPIAFRCVGECGPSLRLLIAEILTVR